MGAKPISGASPVLLPWPTGNSAMASSHSGLLTPVRCRSGGGAGVRREQLDVGPAAWNRFTAFK